MFKRDKIINLQSQQKMTDFFGKLTLMQFTAKQMEKQHQSQENLMAMFGKMTSLLKKEKTKTIILHL